MPKQFQYQIVPMVCSKIRCDPIYREHIYLYPDFQSIVSIRFLIQNCSIITDICIWSIIIPIQFRGKQFQLSETTVERVDKSFIVGTRHRYINIVIPWYITFMANYPYTRTPINGIINGVLPTESINFSEYLYLKAQNFLICHQSHSLRNLNALEHSLKTFDSLICVINYQEGSHMFFLNSPRERS